MPDFPLPTVIRGGNRNRSAPLVVLLHGRGANENDMMPMANSLPQSVSFAALRAPIAEGQGFAWFANRGIGRPIPESLAATMDWFTRWLDEEAAPERPVILIGFSGGAAFAGGLVLREPQRFAGAAILYGTLPFDGGVPTIRGRLTGVNVFVAQGEQDNVIPRELLDRTWNYVLTDSGAPALAMTVPGGHDMTSDVLGSLREWVRERVQYLERHGSGIAHDADPKWAALGGTLRERAGPPPDVTHEIPQQQTSQNAPRELQDAIYQLGMQLKGVRTGPSAISVPGARAFTVNPGADEWSAFIVRETGEFAHLHPPYDGSMHLALPPQLHADVIKKGWGIPHPLAGLRLSSGMCMVFGPRDEDELVIVSEFLRASHAYATGGR